MKPAPFVYHAPTTVDEVTGLLTVHGEDAKVLAGGQSLIPMLNMRLARFDALIDIGRIGDLRNVHRANGTLRIGAMVRQCDVDESAEIATAVPLLAAATPFIGHFQIRSRGTLGGSIAHADPAAEYPAVALALDAEFEVTGSAGPRTIAAADFFTGMWSTILTPDQIVVAARFPVWGPGAGFAVDEVARRHGDFAIAGAAVGVRIAGARIDRAAIALFGMGGTPLRARNAEVGLVGAEASDIDPREVGQVAVKGLDPPDDVHASRELRRRIGATVVARALGRAVKEAGVD